MHGSIDSQSCGKLHAVVYQSLVWANDFTVSSENKLVDLIPWNTDFACVNTLYLALNWYLLLVRINYCEYMHCLYSLYNDIKDNVQYTSLAYNKDSHIASYHVKDITLEVQSDNSEST